MEGNLNFELETFFNVDIVNTVILLEIVRLVFELSIVVRERNTFINRIVIPFDKYECIVGRGTVLNIGLQINLFTSIYNVHSSYSIVIKKNLVV